MTNLKKESIADFKRTVWDFYGKNSRTMPWRQDTRDYYVLVSELMLQQTQVPRVIPKFEAFTRQFPDFKTLAAAPLSQVITAWIGLGYNRRARFLQVTSMRVVEAHGGKLPNDRAMLEALPGIGPNTAGAILAYVFNQPVLFIETNIRSVYLHHFFADQWLVDDKQIMQLLARTIDKTRPREWYWALMDYGTHLKTTGNNIARSKQYKKQSKFEGSLRQMRGEIIRRLNGQDYALEELAAALVDDRFLPALHGLKQDGLVQEKSQRLHLTGSVELR